MAKTIKKIICPQCGSNEVVETKQDHYHCKSCNTQFFLDNDDITINHNYNTGSRNNEQGVQMAKKAIIAVSAVIFVYFGYQLTSFLLMDTSTSPTVNALGYDTTPPATRPPREVSASYFSVALMNDPKGNDVIVYSGWYNDIFADKGKEDEVVTVILDTKEGKELSRNILDVDLSLKGSGTSSSRIDYYRGTNDELFMIVNNYYLFLYNPSQKLFENVTDTFFNKYPEFAGGVAAIESRTFDGCLTVTNNKGKQYAVYEGIEVILPIDKVGTIYDVPLPNGVKKVSYRFSSIGHDFPEEEIQLIQYEHLIQKGYPEYNVNFSWAKDFGGSGVFSERSPYNKVLVRPFAKIKAKIITVKDLTPNHTYVDGGHIITSDSESVTIAIKMSVLTNETYSLQKISAKDGSIIWTKKTDWKEIREVSEEGNNVLVRLSNSNIAVISKDGDIKMTSDLYQIKTIGKEI